MSFSLEQTIRTAAASASPSEARSQLWRAIGEDDDSDDCEVATHRDDEGNLQVTLLSDPKAIEDWRSLNKTERFAMLSSWVAELLESWEEQEAYDE